MVNGVRIGRHPVFIFLKDELKMNLSEFSLMSGIPQSTVSTWIERERRIEGLPVYFFVSLSNLANLTLDDVYNELIRLESEYRVNQVNDKKFILDEGISLTRKVEKEASIVKAEFSEKEKDFKILRLLKDLKNAMDKKQKVKFLSSVIKLYESVERTFPAWFTDIFEDDDTFVQISESFVGVFSKK
ncbi:MAG: hypothetical protein RR904_04260 [Bacilli bacterium]